MTQETKRTTDCIIFLNPGFSNTVIVHCGRGTYFRFLFSEGESSVRCEQCGGLQRAPLGRTGQPDGHSCQIITFSVLKFQFLLRRV